jgi:hypothetical protein
MSLHDDLLETARALIRRNQNRPTQADLRRSISTAYYALFHRLIEDGIERLGLATGTSQPEAIGRAFGHTDMRNVCLLLQKSPLPPQLTPLFGRSVPTELKDVAAAFIELQRRRHSADYDRGREPPFNKADARAAASLAEAAFRNWDLVRGTPAAQMFLVLLLLGERLNRG